MTFAEILQKVGVSLIAIGGMVALCNWVLFFMDKTNQRRGIQHHVSMIGLLGLGLPLGCLFLEPLRWHALWIGFLDPFYIWNLRGIVGDIRKAIHGEADQSTS